MPCSAILASRTAMRQPLCWRRALQPGQPQPAEVWGLAPAVEPGDGLLGPACSSLFPVCRLHSLPVSSQAPCSHPARSPGMPGAPSPSLPRLPRGVPAVAATSSLLPAQTAALDTRTWVLNSGAAWESRASQGSFLAVLQGRARCTAPRSWKRRR